MNGRIRRLAPFVALAALLLLFFHRIAFTNLILARGDTFLYFYPYWDAAAAALREGRVPLWNPALFMGAPLLANSQVGFFYPLNWAPWLALATPYAVKASILLHLFLAAAGAFLAARRVLALSRAGALVTAVTFALGGYLTAQVEHVNQLQGLAWLPWFLLVLGRPDDGLWPTRLRRALLVGLLFALQLLAGHTQTAFITGIALFLWLSGQLLEERLRRRAESGLHVGRFVPLVLGAAVAFAVAAVQLLPTLELTTLSSRQGGLPANEVLSFSLHPLLLTRALLPAYGQALFSEYTAVLPLTALALATVGAWQWRRRAGVLPALLWVALGLVLALGVFTPVYWLLARLPGFDLFRVPARWLVLYALGVALLAGVGWDVVRAATEVATTKAAWRRFVQRPLRVFLVVIVGLMAWGFVAGRLAALVPTGPEAPYEPPTPSTVALWGVELALLLLLIGLWRRERWPRARALGLALLGVGVLFVATRTHPYNTLTAPQAYFDLRPPIARLQAMGGAPPDRFLSLSNIFFDPGDQGEIESIYADQLSAAALYDYIIAVKQKEIIAPNLPLTFDLAAVDGFDGGILPLNAYSQLMRLILPPGVETTDGRLREQLTAVPAARWLNLFNARYLITDKVGDEWREGVFFDRQHPVTLAAGETAAVGYVPPYEATELWLLATAAPEVVVVETSAGTTWRLASQRLADDLYRVAFPQPATAAAITVAGCASPCTVQALTLVDARDETFSALVLGDYRLIHSGDVKIYENLAAQPRAFLLYDWQWQPDVAASVAAMADPALDLRATAVLVAPDDAPLPEATAVPEANGTAVVRAYAPERVVVATESAAPGLLVLTDAAYPGWQAFVDGAPAPLYQADGLFRGVFVPAGRHEVVFTFRSPTFAIGRVVTLAALLLLLGAALWLRPAPLNSR